MKKFLSIGLQIALLATLLPFSSTVNAQEWQEPQRTISTSGVGTIEVEPDIARFTLSLESRNAELKVAQDEVTEVSVAVTNMLLEAGIAEKDVYTSSYQVTTENRYDRNGNFIRIDNYIVRMNINVTVRDLAMVGELLDKSVAAGAVYVNSITFAVDNPDPFIHEARMLAITDARTRAEDYATGSGSVLTGLLYLWEGVSTMPAARDGAAYSSAPMEASADSYQSSAPVQVNPGTTTIKVTVDTTWTIVPGPEFAPMATPES